MLRVYDSVANLVHTIPGYASGGTWISDEPRNIAFNRGLESFPQNSGYYARNLDAGLELQIRCNYAGEAATDSNVWGPQAFGSMDLVLTKYVTATGNIEVVLALGTTAIKLADVTDTDIHDYRLAWVASGPPALTSTRDLSLEDTPGDGSSSLTALFIEKVPRLEIRPDIFRLHGSTGSLYLAPVFRACSFGFSASLPPESPVSDMERGNTYYKAVAYMRAHGIISGYGDGSFGPNNTMLRAQFSKMIDGALYLKVLEEASALFTDLGPDKLDDLYPHEYVGVAAAEELVMGYPGGAFKPYNQVTWAQVMTILVRAGNRFVDGRLWPAPAGWEGDLTDYRDPTHGTNALRG